MKWRIRKTLSENPEICWEKFHETCNASLPHLFEIFLHLICFTFQDLGKYVVVSTIAMESVGRAWCALIAIVARDALQKPLSVLTIDNVYGQFLKENATFSYIFWIKTTQNLVRNWEEWCHFVYLCYACIIIMKQRNIESSNREHNARGTNFWIFNPPIIPIFLGVFI